jgi:putative Holliday junction resolvase
MLNRILAIDYGEKRIGLALSDPMQIFAKPFITIANLSLEHIFAELGKVIKEQNVGRIIIGIPWSLEGTETDKTTETLEFISKLKEQFDLPIIGWDERFTTSDANELLKEMGYNWKEARKVIDAMAACVILKRYLESSNREA